MRGLRLGPSVVFINPPNSGRKVAELFGAKATSFDDAIAASNELETILVPAEETDYTPFSPEREAYLIHERADVVFKEIINSGVDVRRVILESKYIVMRVPSDPKKAAGEIARMYGGDVTTFENGLMVGEEKDTLVLLTTKKLSSPLSIADIAAAVLIRRPFLEVYRNLSVQLPIILHRAMPEGYRELTVKIYDTARRYDENVERVMLVIEDLDVGFIVGEGWDWDYPRPFMRVPVYRLKIITWERPERIKFLLKGLEYRGYKRLCDIDVFENGKKISWVEVSKGMEKLELARKAREELERLLSREAKERLENIEEKLISS